MIGDRWPVGRTVSVLMGVVVGLTFLFGFGNVLNLALRLGVPGYVAPLVAPAVDLTVVGLLIATRHLAEVGAPLEVLRPARRMLLGASAATLALNVTDPLLAGHWGRAAFDAVGPLLLIGWSEVGPSLLSAMEKHGPERRFSHAPVGTQDASTCATDPASKKEQRSSDGVLSKELLSKARVENAWHWAKYRRPISAETLRRSLRVGAAKSRALAAAVRHDDVPLTSSDGR